MNIEIELECDICGRRLETKYKKPSGFGDISIPLVVVPCSICQKDEYERGREDERTKQA